MFVGGVLLTMLKVIKKRWGEKATSRPLMQKEEGRTAFSHSVFSISPIEGHMSYVCHHSPWRSWKIVSLTSPDPAGPAAGLPCPRLNHFVAAPAFFVIFYFSAFYPQLNLSLFVFVIVLGFSLSISLFQLFRPNISHFQSLENCRSTLLN